ncbi:MAG: hydroxysqualene dehydroxylase HpnE [Rubrivivax sp.]|nr:hydroxysqualene dehydroxylase HpnE [Rubrivivax sp.]
MKLAVVGGGWAGLAAAVRATEAGHAVTLFEMAGHWGGRAREVDVDGLALDNGQHILIGAYRRTLALMHTVGSDVEAGLHRRPLELRFPDGRGLRLRGGPTLLAFGRGVLGADGWTAADKVALLATAARWALARFRCAPGITVDELCAGLPPAVRQLLIDPLCVAALNTPAEEASATVWLRVLQDALFGGPGAADLLLPRRSLGALLPRPAAAWLQSRGATLSPGTRVQAIWPDGGGWRVDGQPFDAVVLACTAAEAARLSADIAPAWAARARALRYEPIVTVYLRCPGARLSAPMMALVDGPQAPAQFAFDHGALGATPGVFAFVVSGARAWAQAGVEATAAAVLQQARSAFPRGTWPVAPTVLRTVAEKRATFRCVPALDRPPAGIAPGLVAAGDYVQGPYPATLEGAVRSGEAALAGLPAWLVSARSATRPIS